MKKKNIMKAVLERKLSFMGYPQYSVDTDGNVFSHKGGEIRKMRCTESNKGYYFVSLCNNGIKKCFKVHRLVSLAFLPNPDNKPCIDHINGNRSDNRVCNLKWCSHKENNNNPITKERRAKSMWGKHFTEEHKRKLSEANKGENNPMFGRLGKNNPMARAVLQYTKDGQFVAEFKTIKEGAQLTNTYGGHISDCCRGKRKSAGGYIWRYKEEN